MTPRTSSMMPGRFWHVLIAAAFLCLPLQLFPVSHEVVYLEGYPYARTRDGDEIELDIGDQVQTGETVITSSNETVELEAQGYKVVIDENTVFSLREIESKGKKTDVLSCALGKLKFSREKMLGTEPRLATNSAVCGVRGTSFIVMSGVDGSSLIVVEEGSVEVEAAGETVSLSANEGVEIVTGFAPGEIFEVKRGFVDYREWNQAKLDGLLDDPVGAAENISDRLAEYTAELGRLVPAFTERQMALKETENKSAELFEKEGKEERDKYFNENVAPLRRDVTYLHLNIRHYALSALSLRRYVLGRMYLILKSRYITDPGNKTYQKFLSIKDEILDSFETQVVPHLVVQDI